MTSRLDSLRAAFCWLAALLVLYGCAPPDADSGSSSQKSRGTAAAAGRSDLIIFHAASLARPFQQIEERMEKTYPGLNVIRESSSSRLAIRKAADLGRRADIVAVADEALLRKLMLPDHCDFIAVFARNRVVLAYTDQSKYRSEINAQNWYDVLLRDDVNFGYADPNMAPVGYRTRLCWKLASNHYRDALGERDLHEELTAACPKTFIRPHCNELIPLLEALTLDYTLQYQSVAQQHHLEWLKLPDEVDLGNETLGDWYSQASIEVRGKAPGQTITRIGKPIVYGVTKPHTCTNDAMADEFLHLLLSAEGQKIMEANFQESVIPPLCKNTHKAPEAIRSLVMEAEFHN